MSIAQVILLIIAIETPTCPHLGDYCYCIGDGGASIGCCQIQKQYVDDINRVYGLSYQWSDAYHKETAKDMTRLYLAYWVTPERISRPVTIQDYLRVHNAGPNGWKKDCSLPYWRKAELLLCYRDNSLLE